MADYIVTSGELTTVANAIREKNGTSSNLSWPDGFVSGISSGGGGGSSDFSTAKVTVASTNGRLIGASHIVREGDDEFLMCAITEAGEYDVIIYKGNALLMASIEAGDTITVSGNAETSGSEIFITGDCTITIS